MAQENAGEKKQHQAAQGGSQMHDKQAMPARLAAPPEEDTMASKVATVAIVGLGAALIEAELIPGILIGVAAMLAPNVVPKIGRSLRPFIKGAVRAGYAFTERAKETIAEAGEQFQDIVAEVHAEQDATHPATGSEHPKHA